MEVGGLLWFMFLLNYHHKHVNPCTHTHAHTQRKQMFLHVNHKKANLELRGRFSLRAASSSPSPPHPRLVLSSSCSEDKQPFCRACCVTALLCPHFLINTRPESQPCEA